MLKQPSRPQQGAVVNTLPPASPCVVCPRVNLAAHVSERAADLADHHVQTLADFCLDRQGIAETVLSYLRHTTPCFAAGVLLVDEGCAEVVLCRCRPVDDLFLQAMQQRLMRSYRLFAGTALAEPAVQVTVLGEAVSGPYEPPRSLLTTPILSGGPVSGMIAIASIFPDAFCSGDLCTLSVLAAKAAMSLGNARLAALRQDP